MARNKFQAVKDVVPIELHIQKYESDLHPEGNSLIGSHHTHQSDGGRCLTVDTNNNQFKCWNCEITGSVIDYEADRLGIDIYAAAQELADVYNITLPDENPEQRAARKVANEKRASVQELMKEAFMLYHGNLPSENYFLERGITAETIESDLLGYAPLGRRWLASKLSKLNSDRAALLGTGLFYKNEDGVLNDRYQDVYVFPYWYRGKPVFSIARSINQNVKTYKKYVKHLVKSDKYPFVNDRAVRHILWGEDKVQKDTDILMAEGIIDAILARQSFGDEYVVISPVTSNVSKVQMERLAELTTRAKSITIVADSEESGAGERGAMASAEHIRAQWTVRREQDDTLFRKVNKKNADGEMEPVVVYPPTRIARLQLPPDVEKRDLSDYITSGQKDELLYWIKAAQPLKYHKQRENKDIRRFFSGKTTFLAKLMIDECELESNYFLDTAEQLHRYQDGIYKPDGANFIRVYSKNVLGEAWTATRYQSLLDWLINPVEADEVNSDPNILNVQNGLLHLDTSELHPHSPYYLSNTRIPVDYRNDAAWEVNSTGQPVINPESGNPKFTAAGKAVQRFITSVVPLDAVDLIYEMSGYCLSTEARYDRAFILTGAGANGKGTLLKLVTAMLGAENVSNETAQALSENDFRAAELFGKNANICADIPSNPLKDTSAIKMITSGDRISAERKHQQPFQFRPFATLIFSANEIPRSRDRTYAFYRRMSYISFPNRFEGTARDEGLIDSLTSPDNLSAFLSLSLSGLNRLWTQHGFSDSPSSNAVMEDYKMSNDNVAPFLAEHMTEAPGERVPRLQVYEAYRAFCEENGYSPMSTQRFNATVQSHLPNVERQDSPRPLHWFGMDFRKP